MRKIFLLLLPLFIILFLGIFFLRKSVISQNIPRKCQISEVIYYYSDQCTWCNKLKSEGTLDELDKLGVKIKKINTNIGPIRHKLEITPTFVIDNKVYPGYRSLGELKKLLACQ